jgi:ABC-2 type transport system ATP-binding protein
MIEPAVKVDNLVKRYPTAVAVDGISFTVARGVTAALLGGNGAGKTTTLSILLGLLLPTAGRVRVLGEDMLRHRYRVLPQMNFPTLCRPAALADVRQNCATARLMALAAAQRTSQADLQISSRAPAASCRPERPASRRRRC